MQLALVAGRAVVLAAVGLAASSCATADSDTLASTPRAPAAGRSLVVLEDDTSPLRVAFNAQSERWRTVALVSPTCSECILGAEVVKQQLTDRYAPERLAAFVVWIPMLPTDNHKAAQSSATMFPRGRAEQYYDARQSLGWDYAHGPFAGFMQRAREHTPDEDPMAAAIDERARDESPQWDLYMLYAPGVIWESGAKPPPPTHWIRHCGRQDGETSTYWRDSPDTPPQRGSLSEAMRAMADEALAGKPAAASGRVLQLELLSFGGCPDAHRLRAALEQAVRLHGGEIAVVDVDLEELPADDPRRGWPSPTVLVEGHDLFGLSPTRRAEPGCRIYPGGLPGVAEISAALEAYSRSPTASGADWSG